MLFGYFVSLLASRNLSIHPTSFKIRSDAETPIESTSPVPSDFALQHDHTNASHLLLVRQVALIDSTGNRCCTVVVDIIVKLAITSAELELFEEEGVVVDSESVENVEFGLGLLAFLS